MNRLRAVLLIHITHHSSFSLALKNMFGKGDFFESFRHFAFTEERENFFTSNWEKTIFCDDNEDSDLFPATDKTEASLIIV